MTPNFAMAVLNKAGFNVQSVIITFLRRPADPLQQDLMLG